MNNIYRSICLQVPNKGCIHSTQLHSHTVPRSKAVISFRLPPSLYSKYIEPKLHLQMQLCLITRAPHDREIFEDLYNQTCPEEGYLTKIICAVQEQGKFSICTVFVRFNEYQEWTSECC